VEDPGVNSLRGSFGTVGSIIRQGHRPNAGFINVTPRVASDPSASHFGGLKRHQLYDPPVPSSTSTPEPPLLSHHIDESPPKRRPVIRFESRDLVHIYARVGSDDDRSTVHEYRDSNLSPSDVSPPFRPEDPFASINRLPTIPHPPLSISPPQGFGLVGPPPPEHHIKPSSTGQHLKSPSAKKYPKGIGVDDEEESEYLWQRTGSDSDEGEIDSEIEIGQLREGCIRLVATPRR